MENNAYVLAELTHLRNMTIEELRTYWSKLYNSSPPQVNNKLYLTRKLAYRIQELIYGGNSEELSARLELKADEYFGSGKNKKTKRAKRFEKKAITGSVLMRYYQGVEYQVAVLDDGYQYQGRKYRSLSAIAGEITGMHWSGNAFFGLNKKLETKVGEKLNTNPSNTSETKLEVSHG